ncbi:peptide/nickel transport system substrate-binding protein [Falsiroseomonas stagni DSM 19981]|uniref:Peptide/nickel transport system substrate-binding protein n=2 Tax=Falsiroseomonas TaxID=2870713 RepID=A0A1I4CWC7_9PROT|nr:peptide/nickel transport system substrate-binding protein [Falsiroseomonas stagni DSM 19981]
MLTRRQLGLAATAAAAGSPLAKPAIAQGARGTVVMAQQAQPPSLDAQVTTAQASRNINLHVYETLFARDEAGNPKPDLAEGVDISADGLTYRFSLRDARFHNGKRLTSADVKASLLRYGRVGGSAFIMQPVEAIDTPDAKTVVVRLKEPSPGFIAGISSPRAPCAIIPEEEAGKDASRIEVIGTGPFRFVEFRPDSHVRLTRFSDYVQNTVYQGMDGFAGRKVANVENLMIRFVPEGGARTAGLQAGEIQILEAIAVPAAQRLRNDRNLAMHEMMPWSFQTLMLNHVMPPMDNPVFRRALQAALDLEEIMAISTDGLYRMTHGWQHPGTEFFAGDVGRPLYNINSKDRARALLREAGYRNEEIILLGDSSFSNHQATIVTAAEQLRAVGINVKVVITDWPTAFSQRTQRTGWHLWALMLGIEPYEGPYGVVGFFSGHAPVQHARDEVIEDCQRRLTTSLSAEERKKAVSDFQARMYDQAIAIKCGDVGIVQATRASVRDYKPYRIPRMWGISLA